jgi:hypothetical protein
MSQGDVDAPVTVVPALNQQITAPLLVTPTAGQRFHLINGSESIAPTMLVVPDNQAALIIENHAARVGATVEIEHAKN